MARHAPPRIGPRPDPGRNRPGPASVPDGRGRHPRARHRPVLPAAGRECGARSRAVCGHSQRDIRVPDQLVASLQPGYGAERSRRSNPLVGLRSGGDSVATHAGTWSRKRWLWVRRVRSPLRGLLDRLHRCRNRSVRCSAVRRRRPKRVRTSSLCPAPSAGPIPLPTHRPFPAHRPATVPTDDKASNLAVSSCGTANQVTVYALLRVASATGRLPLDSGDGDAARDVHREPAAPEVTTMNPAPRGQVLIIGAVAMVVLLGIAALVVDLGFGWMLRRQEQNAVDPAAVAAARYIPDNWTTGIGPRRIGQRASTSSSTASSRVTTLRATRREAAGDMYVGNPRSGEFVGSAGRRGGLDQCGACSVLRSHVRSVQAWVATSAVAANGAERRRERQPQCSRGVRSDILWGRPDQRQRAR